MNSQLTPSDLALLRLHSQRILPTSTGPAQGPVDVVRYLTALQGQDFPGSLWSIGLRVPGTTRADVESAFNRGEIVRSWALRGTLHVTAAEDLGWMLTLIGAKSVQGASARHCQLEITTPDLQTARDAALTLLAGPNARATREELFAGFEAAGQRTAAQRGMHLLWLLGMEGTLVQGPVNPAGKGNTQFFVCSDQWINIPRVLAREEALAELTLRYFSSHGPATIKDFQWWSKLTLADINTGLDQVKDQFESVKCGESSYFLAPETAQLLSGSQGTKNSIPGIGSVFLLPGFDEYLLGYTDRSAALAPHHAPLTVPGNNGMFKATIVFGGQVTGTWRKAQSSAEKQRQMAGVVLGEFFDGVSPAQNRALEKAAQAYSKFLTKS